MAKRRFFKRTKGFNAEVFIGKDLTYSTIATAAAFGASNTPLGLLGIYDDAGALVPTNTQLVEGKRYKILQKTLEGLHASSPFVFRKSEVKLTSYAAPVKEVYTITFAGNYGTEFKLADEISVKVIEQTPGSQRYPTITYDYSVKAGDTPTIIAAALRDQINNPNDPRNITEDWFVVATSNAGVLTLTAKYEGSTFRVAMSGKSYEIGTIAHPTNFNYGSGFYEDVKSYEIEGNIWRGVTTQYPLAGFSPEDFGVADVFVDPAKTYDIININEYRREKSPTPVDVHQHYYKAVLCIPTEGTLNETFSILFGFSPTV